MFPYCFCIPWRGCCLPKLPRDTDEESSKKILFLLVREQGKERPQENRKPSGNTCPTLDKHWWKNHTCLPILSVSGAKKGTDLHPTRYLIPLPGHGQWGTGEKWASPVIWQQWDLRRECEVGLIVLSSSISNPTCKGESSDEMSFYPAATTKQCEPALCFPRDNRAQQGAGLTSIVSIRSLLGKRQQGSERTWAYTLLVCKEAEEVSTPFLPELCQWCSAGSCTHAYTPSSCSDT